MLGQLLPEHAKISFDIANRLMTKKEISNLIDIVYRECGQKETVIFCDRIMTLGFTQAFKAGISFGKDDMVVPENKWKVVDETRALAKDYEQQFQDGLITQREKYNKVVDAWSKCSDRLATEMMQAHLDREEGRERARHAGQLDLHDVAFRRARLARRRCASSPPCAASWRSRRARSSRARSSRTSRKASTVLEYFNSTHGARKGLADTALKTANSGYLTRRLVDVAQDSIITSDDCGSKNGIVMRAIVDAGQVVASLASRILGRTAAQNIDGPGRQEGDRARPAS